ncbi:MAG: M23 family metallopeptidase [Betaproteobacteria bacterium]|nr:M23 family metallopeptidase [Betaproteobacteria bacterium]
MIEPLALQPTTETPAGSVFVREEQVRRGDTVASLLNRLGVYGPQALSYLRDQPAAAPIFEQLAPGRQVTAATDAHGELRWLRFPLNDHETSIIVDHQGDVWDVSRQPLAAETRVVMKSGVIRSTLFGATDAMDVPDAIALRLAEIFGSEIDFHRDLREGDRFSVVYEMVYSGGHALRPGRVLAAEFVNQDTRYRAAWFEDAHGRSDYYDPDGKPLRKAFLRSPLEFSRVSSGLSMRFHPILRQWRAHKGVDYAAPAGTKVRATTDAIVEFIGGRGGYGKLVELRHQGRTTTAYAHLSRFAAGLRAGTRVSQGEVIGFVGATGWATGPHLHYEFRIDGRHRDPLRVALPGAVPLAGGQLSRFRTEADPLLARLDQIAGLNLALLD